MGIQVRRTGSADYGRWIKALIAGDPGSGKTLISSTFPNVLYASAEGGMMSVHDRDVLTVDIKESGQLLELKSQLDQKPNVREKFFGGPVDTVVIDTIDEVARILQKERIDGKKADSMAMADWGWFGDQLRAILRGYRNLDMHVIFTCHIKTTTDGESGATFVAPAIQGQVGDEVAGYVDLALLLQARPHTEIKDGETIRSIIRYLQTYPDARHPWIKDRSGKLPMEFPVTFEDDYKRMEVLIYGDLEARQAREHELAAQQVAQMAETLAAETAVETPAQVDQKPEPEPQPEPEPEEQGKPLDERMAEEDAKAAEVAVAPAPQPEAQPEPTPAPEPETVSAAGTTEPEAPPADDLTCQACGGQVENNDQKDLSQMRFRETLCRTCFVAKKKK